MYVKKTVLYLFVYPIIVIIILMILAIIIAEFGFNPLLVGMAVGCVGLFIFLNIIITWWAFYFGYMNTYKSTKFVIEGDKILYIRLKERNAIAGGTFYFKILFYYYLDNEINVCFFDFRYGF